MVTAMRLAGWVVLVSLSLGCDGGDSAAFGGGDGGIGEDSFQDDDPPMGDCDDTECGGDGVGEDGAGGAPGAPVGSPCDGTNQCESGVCAATFDGDDAGSLECQAACIDVMNQGMWCSDSGSCCEGLVCTTRGLCVPDDGAGQADGGGTTGGSDDGSNDPGDGSGDGSTGGSSGGSGDESTGGSTGDGGESTN